ncbi:MAG: hypothetical protein HY268_21530, partial [Deltaproteobacteria bacterium]|nr:hypothetical protein [Deltaproteobacteria bacterium]
PHPTTALHLPTTVQGVLAARIDRLAADEKALLQQFAVIGREFSLSLAKQVVSQPEDELYRLLSSLQHKEFLYEQPAFPEPDYIFKHALTQEVAYGTVLQERRKALHQRTAQAIEELYDTNLDEHYSDLAHHYSRSESTAKAVQYLHLAGQQAAQRAAYADAVRSLTTALELLQTLPETAQRNQQELALQISLGAPLAITKGNAAPEVEVAYIRARELCQQGGETTQLFPVLWGLAYVYVMRSEYKTALELAQQCLALAESTQDPAFLLEAHYMMGVVLAGPGEFVPALEHFQQSIARYDPQQHHSLAFIYGQQDPGVICRVDAAQMLWELGYPDQALKMNREALTLARELSHPFSLVWALVIAAQLHYLNREGAATQEQAEAAITLCTEHGLSQWLVWGSIYRGCALVEQGRGEEGIAEIRQSLATYQSTGAEAGQVLFLTLLAEAYGRTGQAEEGLAVLAEAQIEMNKTEQLWSEAMLHQLKGELTLQSRPQSPESRVKEAEEYFLKTLEIARRRQAKSWELRAATHLARLWQQQGRTTEAYRLLSNTYGWFTEGFDTKDLQEAQALLDSLR